MVQRNAWQRSGSRLHFPLSPGELHFFSSPFFFPSTCDESRSNLWKLGSEDSIRLMILLTSNTRSPCTQELPKYLRGYHHCTKEEMVQLAALLFRVKVKDDKTQFVMITKMLKELVPNDQLKAMSAEDWRKVRNLDIMRLIITYYTIVLLNASC